MKINLQKVRFSVCRSHSKSAFILLTWNTWTNKDEQTDWLMQKTTTLLKLYVCKCRRNQIVNPKEKKNLNDCVHETECHAMNNLSNILFHLCWFYCSIIWEISGSMKFFEKFVFFNPTIVQPFCHAFLVFWNLKIKLI